MKTTADAERYLMELFKRQCMRPVHTSGIEPFITISRQAGAGGHSAASAILNAFITKGAEPFNDWQIFDRTLAEGSADNPEIETALPELFQDYHSQIGEFVLGLFGRQVPQDLRQMRLSRVIRSVAMLGRVIIVGYGGAEVSRDLRNGVHLRLVAPEPVRVQRIMAEQQVGEAEARQIVHNRDRERARMVKDHFGIDIDDPLRYDAIWNTATVSLETIAAATIGLIESRLARMNAKL